MAGDNGKDIRIEFSTRKFNGDVVELYVKYPTQKQISEADFIYRSEFAKAIRQGDTFTNDEVPAILEKKGAWNKEKEEKVAEISKEIKELRDKLSKSKSDKDGREIVKSIQLYKSQASELESGKHFWYNQTANAIAEEARLQYYVINCTYNKNTNDRYFSSRADFEVCIDLVLIQDCILHAMHIINGFTENINNSLPENKWITEHSNSKEK